MYFFPILRFFHVKPGIFCDLVFYLLQLNILLYISQRFSLFDLRTPSHHDVLHIHAMLEIVAKNFKKNQLKSLSSSLNPPFQLLVLYTIWCICKTISAQLLCWKYAIRCTSHANFGQLLKLFGVFFRQTLCNYHAKSVYVTKAESWIPHPASQTHSTWTEPRMLYIVYWISMQIGKLPTTVNGAVWQSFSPVIITTIIKLSNWYRSFKELIYTECNGKK